MQNIRPYLEIDGKLLKMLITILETRSITQAANNLDLTQSAVSHALDKLRSITHDPLFVKSGRGIVPTERAINLGLHAKSLLESMQKFSQSPIFNPIDLEIQFTIAANDLQRDLLLPALTRVIAAQAPKVKLKIIDSGAPTLEMFRDQNCHIVISPRPPHGSDIMHKRLFDDQYTIFYDANFRDAPKSMVEYLNAQHISVEYMPPRPLILDQFLASQNLIRDVCMTTSGFSGIPPFLKGSRLLATLPSLLKANLFKEFAMAPVPCKCPVLPMYLIWHRKYQLDPAHKWLRDELLKIVQPAIEMTQNT